MQATMDDLTPLEAKPKPVRKRTPKAAPTQAAPTPKPVRQSKVAAWAKFGVGLSLVLSAGLNGYANSQHATVAWAGWAMGFAVPVLVLVLSKVAGETHRSNKRSVSLFAAGSGAALLALSVFHCAESIALLTGSHLILAVPMAVAVDAGLVACELALVTDSK